jgi:UDP-glucuronate 4-epimerase
LRALVTGCAGFIGSHLTEQLLSDGHEVIGVDCLTPYYDPDVKIANLANALDHDAFALLRVDLSRDPLDGLLDGAGVIFHLAGQPGVRPSFGAGFADYVRHNVEASQRLFEAASVSRPRAIVYASSSSVYGDPAAGPMPETQARRPRSPYGMTKVATEELAHVYERAFMLPAVGLRYFTAYGPRQRPDMAFHRWITAGLDGRPITIMGDGTQIRDFTYVDDVVASTLAAAERGRPGAVYNVGGGVTTSLLGALTLLDDVLATRLTLRFIPSSPGDVLATCADSRLAEADLGLSPSTPLAEGLRRQVDAMATSQHAYRPVPT